MVSRSCANFLDLSSYDLLDFPQNPRGLPRIMTVLGIIIDTDINSAGALSFEVSLSTGCSCERKIIVANMLPLQSKRDAETEIKFFHIGFLIADVESHEQ